MDEWLEEDVHDDELFGRIQEELSIIGRILEDKEKLRFNLENLLNEKY